VTQFVSKEPGRECLHCSAILSWRHKKYCNNACRAAGNGFQPPKGRPFVRGPSSQATPEFRASVIAMWDDGATASEIGMRHGRTKNSIIGYVHRWHLPPRPSPITLVYGPPRPPRAPMPRAVPRHVPTLAPLSSLSMPTRRTAPIIPPKRERAVRVPQDKPHVGRVEPCCFPIGDPGTKGFRYCDDPSEPGRPYCSAHMKVAYIRTPRISTFGLGA